MCITSYDMVYEFHERFRCSIADGIDDLDNNRLRVELIREELQELQEALEGGDIIEVADALADLDYVVNGAAISFGIVLPIVTEEVHRSNMTKLLPDGTPLLREDGKVLKGPNYEQPNIRKALNNGGLVITE